MALLIDGPPTNIELLRDFESGILDVAETEGIDLDAKLSLADEEISDAILQFLLNAGTRDTQRLRQMRGVSDVVASPALRRWHTLKTLEHVYRDAFGHQLNERYQQKLDEYKTAGRQAQQKFYESGVGIVLQPVPKPPPAVVSGQGDGPTSFYLAVTWTNADGSEGAPSDPLMVNLGTGGILLGPSGTAWTGKWNVYAGSTLDHLTKQNIDLLESQANWVFPGVLTTQGMTPGKGQTADYFVVNHNTLQRG